MRIGTRRTLRTVGALVALSTIAACGGSDADTTIDTGMGAGMGATVGADTGMAGMGGMNDRWTATLEPRGGTNVTGTANVMAGTGAGTTMAEVTLNGAPANGVHPWHIHAGTCASGGDIVGPPADYPPLNADANGTATASATVNVAAPTTGEYHINVHMSPTDLGTIVACGDLRMGAM